MKYIKRVFPQPVRAASMTVEMGFGTEQALVNFLKAGANMYGVDLSREAVDKCKETYPQFGDRVAWGRTV